MPISTLSQSRFRFCDGSGAEAVQQSVDVERCGPELLEPKPDVIRISCPKAYWSSEFGGKSMQVSFRTYTGIRVAKGGELRIRVGGRTVPINLHITGSVVISRTSRMIISPSHQSRSVQARAMYPCVLGGVSAVRVSSRLQLATFFTADSPFSRDSRTGPPPALTVDVRVVIRRHFPVVGPGGTRIVEKVAEDLVLRRRPSRQLRQPEKVDRALAKDVMPLVRHRFDRGAVVAAGKDICAHVAAACADPRMAHCGAHVLVLIDTYACPVVFRPPPPGNKPMQPVVCTPSLKNFMLSKTADPCVDFEITALKRKSVGVIGDRRPKSIGVIGDKQPKPEVEERFKGWLPW